MPALDDAVLDEAVTAILLAAIGGVVGSGLDVPARQASGNLVRANSHTTREGRRPQGSPATGHPTPSWSSRFTVRRRSGHGARLRAVDHASGAYAVCGRATHSKLSTTTFRWIGIYCERRSMLRWCRLRRIEVVDVAQPPFGEPVSHREDIQAGFAVAEAASRYSFVVFAAT